MHVILTHEQADFDALAALFGAYLTDESAMPVLPRRMNRNVRAFVTLYGADFPFVDPRDMPQGSIAIATLVDTQSLVTLKGMGKKTLIRVFDHHPLRDGLHEDWELNVFESGATTTFFVEILQERGEPLSVIQATLLLLGIYEDTGTLTYASTAPRDVRAAAWLLEQGASLKIAGEFLNPPLSPEQRAVFERLAAGAESHYINGHRVVIACGDALDMPDEISSLAHKMRDLYDPDALFVLVTTPDGVRLVARSTTDSIDVSAITAHFGGGGHDRAAAALIKTSSTPEQENGQMLETVCQTLFEILPRHVRPSITVSKIMSRGPQVLNLNTPVEKAAELMQRFGYEGYPVVEKGRVVGLLTRRAVDRALGHKLNLTAASLMEAGEVTVQPGDSIQHLQNLMTDTGWGQIPVVDDTGKVIGIVTRTDLLKTLAPQPARGGRRDLTERLVQALPPDRLALIRAVAEEAARQHMPVFVVGGFVRDLLLDRPSLDFDIVVEGDAITLTKALSAQHGGKVTSHSRFGTAKWFIQKSAFDGDSLPEFLDLISARQEFYEHPTALPTVERGSIKLDLHRRDFTINTLAMRLDGHHFGELHDYYGGLADLERRLIRVLHSLSFVDDPTRMLRAVRYEQRYGLSIEPRTRELMDEAIPLIDRLTEERVRHELDLILDEPRAADMFARLHELELMQAIADVLPWSADLRERLDTAIKTPPPPEWELTPPAAGIPLNQALGYALWLLSLAPDQVDTIQVRLRFPVALHKAIRAASSLTADLPSLSGAKPSVWTERLDDTPLLSVYAVWLTSSEPALERYAVSWRYTHPKTDGHTLKALGLPPGPNYQNIIRRLRAAWLDGEIASEVEEENLLNKLIKEMGK